MWKKAADASKAGGRSGRNDANSSHWFSVCF
jgi:hypothetical protein